MNPDIYVGGFHGGRDHLGKTLRSTVEQIRELMHDIFGGAGGSVKVSWMRYNPRSIRISCIIP